MQNPETGLVVSCGDDLAARYQSRGWTALDGAAQPAPTAASEKPKNESGASDGPAEKPARRNQARRR